MFSLLKNDVVNSKWGGDKGKHKKAALLQKSDLKNKKLIICGTFIYADDN